MNELWRKDCVKEKLSILQTFNNIGQRRKEGEERDGGKEEGRREGREERKCTLKDLSEGWRDGSVVMSTYCSS